MPEKEVPKDKARDQKVEKPVEERPVDSATETTEVTAVRRKARWPLITIGIFAAVVTVALIIVSGLLIALHQQGRAHYGIGMMSPDDGRFFRHHGMMGGYLQAAAARGVVTAINGNSVTVSGGGKQVTVKKTSSTSVTGDKSELAVNDTVIVYGSADNNGVVTATKIIVRNTDIQGQATGDDAVDDSTGTMIPGA